MKLRAISTFALIALVSAIACVDGSVPDVPIENDDTAGGGGVPGLPMGGNAGAPTSAGSVSVSGSGAASGSLGSSGFAGSATAGGTTGSGGSGARGGTVSTAGATSKAGSTSVAGSSTGGTTSMPPPVITGGSPGWASRYWDCCKPACGWTGNVRRGSPMVSCTQQNQSMGGNYDARNACEGGGTAYMCWNVHPWSVSSTLSYGFAAASGSSYVCGRCYQLQFTGAGHHGGNVGALSLTGKTMIVQIINNGGVENDQFDLLIPGGGVGALNACSTQFGTSDLGAQYGGFLTACAGDKACVQQRCQRVFAGKPDLQAGCDWFLNWFNAADNPNVVFRQIACPSEITQRSGLQDPG